MNSKKITLSGLLLALGIIIPIAFHVLGAAGKIFLPMHLSVLVAGYLLPPVNALVVGLLTPFLSSVLTGMPITYPIMPIMVVELGTYGLVISLLNKKGIKNIYFKLVAAMISGRVIAGLMVYFMANIIGLKINALLYVKGSIITGLPGIVIQLIIIPLVIKLLNTQGVFE